MDAVFTGPNGDKRNFLWQYDKGQFLVLENLEYDVAPEVHFTTTALDEALVSFGDYEDGTLRVQIPDALLISGCNITAYIYVKGTISEETEQKIDITVRPRKKPSNYIYTDGMYVMSTTGVTNAVFDFLADRPEMLDDVIVDYTTVHLTDDVTGIEYLVGINDGKLYIQAIS